VGQRTNISVTGIVTFITACALLLISINKTVVGHAARFGFTVASNYSEIMVNVLILATNQALIDAQATRSQARGE
jgi:hypothetical protein